MIKKSPTNFSRFLSTNTLLSGVFTLLLILVANMTYADHVCDPPTAADIANPDGVYDLTTDCAQTLAPQSGGTYEIEVNDNTTYTFTICNPAGGAATPFAELWAEGDDVDALLSSSTLVDGCAVLTYVNCDAATEVYLNVFSVHGTDMCADDWYAWSMTTSCVESIFSCPDAIKLSITDPTLCCYTGVLPLPDFTNYACDIDSYTLAGVDCEGAGFIATDPAATDEFSLPIGVNLITHTITIDGVEIICTQQVTVTKAIACYPSVQVSLDHNCEATISAATFTNYSCPEEANAYTVGLTVNGASVALLNQSHIGGYIIATVTDPHGNSCFSQIILEDKLGPKIACPDDVTLACGADYSIATLGDAVVSDCTDVGSTNVVDVGPTGDPCAGDQTIERTWTSVDILGNVTTCTQVITLVRPDLANIVCPPNYIDVDDDTNAADGEQMLSCDDYPMSTPPGIEVTGGFILSTDPTTTDDDIMLQEGMFCNFLISKTDEIVPTCGGAYDILRVWKIRDWCDATNEETCTQIIKVKDTTDPTGTAGTYTYTSEAHSCIGTVNVTPATWTDGCSGMNVTSYTTNLVQVITDAAGVVTGTGTTYSFPGNGGLLTNIPLGIYNLVYTGADACNNTGEITIENIVLEDNLAPVAVCDNKTVALGTNGEVWLCANTLDDGSYDNCQIIAMKVKRMDADADVPFTDCVGLTCDDAVNGTVNVRFRVYDLTGALTPSDDMPEAMGRYSECMTTITVQDKLRPTCGVQPAITVSCGEDFTTDANYITTPVASDNCSWDFVALADDGAPTSCGDNVIVRQWQLTDPSDATWVGPICKQTITVNATPWTVDPIWPTDHTVDCSTASGTNPEALPAGSNFPTYTVPSDDVCEDLVIGHDDKILENQPGACYIIIRTWKIYDLCQNPGYNTTGPGYWSYNQKITVTDSQGPIFTTTPADKFVDLGDNCSATFFLDPAAASDVCSDDITITRSVPPSFVLNADGSYTAPAGVHSVTYAATDGCGNQTDLPITITIEDNKAPTPIALGLFVTTLMPNGDGCMGQIWASDLHNGSSSDNCPGALSYFVAHYYTTDANGNQIVNTTLPTTTGVEFDENNIGSNLVQLWVVDAAGNADYTVVEIILQDNLGVCIPCNNPTFSVTQDATNCSASVVGVSGGTAPYGYQWAPMSVSDPDFTFTICENSTTCGGLANGGVYQVTVTDATGCSTVNEFTMSCTTTTNPCEGLDFNVVVVNSNPLCTDNAFAEVTFISPGAVADYSYQWLDASGNAVAGCTSGSSCAVLPAGSADYIVRATNGDGCSTEKAFSIDCTGRIAGRVSNEEGGEVQNVEVDVTGMIPLMTDENGEFMFEELTPGNNYTVTPEKDVDHTNGVTTYDLVLISQHILGVQVLSSPYKVIAADANNSGTVSTLDLVELRSLILQIFDEFPNNTSWRFIDKDFVFPNPANPFTTSFPEVISFNSFAPDETLTDFIAVKVGDVNCSATTGNLLGGLVRDYAGDLVLNVEDQKFEAGETVNVTFSAEEFEAMLGYQFTLEFDTDKLSFNDFVSGDLQNCTEDNFGLSMLDQGIITASWNTVSGLTMDEKSELFTLEFVAKAAGNLSDYLRISSKATVAEAYKANANGADLMDVVIGFNNGNTTTVLGGAYELYQNQPNPFNNETRVGFNLPQNETATITIFDVSGKVIKTVNQEFARGYNEVTFNKNELNTSGILYYQLQTSEFTDTRKMLLID